MTKYTKIGLIVLLVIVLIYTIYKFTRKKSLPQQVTAQAPQPSTPAAPTASEAFPLNVGMQGINVKRLQTALNYIYPNNPIPTDGVWGSITTGKLYLTVPTSIAILPLSETSFNKIIAMGNSAVLKK